MATLEHLSIEELEQRSVALKEQQFAIRAERRDILAERTRKVFIKRIRDELTSSPTAKAAVAAGVLAIPDDLTTEQAADILKMVRETKRPGDVRVEPEAGSLRALTGTPDAGGDA